MRHARGMVDWALVMSAVATVMSLVTAWLAGGRHVSRIKAWCVGLGTQGAWLVYALASGHWPFLVSTAAFTAVYVRNIVVWRREAAGVPSPPSA